MDARTFSEISAADLINDNCIFSGELTAIINNLGLGKCNYNSDSSVASVTAKKAYEMLNYYLPLRVTPYGLETQPQLNPKDLMQASGLTTLFASLGALGISA